MGLTNFGRGLISWNLSLSDLNSLESYSSWQIISFDTVHDFDKVKIYF